NALLAAILFAWSYARPLGDDRRRSLFAVGAFAVIAQFLSFKAFCYTVPIALFALVAANREDDAPLWRCLTALSTGAVIALAVVIAAQLLAGTWSLYLAETMGFTNAALNFECFLPAW